MEPVMGWTLAAVLFSLALAVFYLWLDLRIANARIKWLTEHTDQTRDELHSGFRALGLSYEPPIQRVSARWFKRDPK